MAHAYFITVIAVLSLNLVHIADADDISGKLPYICVATGCRFGNCEGTCNCPTDHHGPSCIGFTDGVTCNLCEEDNTVLLGGEPACSDNHECICLEGYHGDNCQHLRVSVSCTGTAMTGTIFPYPSDAQDPSGGFTGVMYMSGTNSFDVDTPCKVDTSFTGPHTFDTIQYDGAQSGDCNGITPEVDGDFRSIYIYQQYKRRYQSEHDKVHHLKCNVALSGELSGAVGGTVTINRGTLSGGNVLESTQAVALNGFTMEMKNEDIGPIGSALNVGDKFHLRMQHAGRFTVKNCIANSYNPSDGVPTDGGDELYLVADSCIPPSALDLMAGPVQHDTTGGQTVTFAMSAWYFIKATHTIYIHCEICFGAECQSTDSPPICNNEMMEDVNSDVWITPTRKRRDVSEGGRTISTSIAVSVGVKNPADKSQDGLSEDGSPSDSCFNTLSVLLPIGVSVSLMLLALAMAIYFYAKNIKKEKNGKV